MLKFALLILFLQWATRKQVGYKVVNRDDPRYMTELSEVTEYYEQRNSGYYKL